MAIILPIVETVTRDLTRIVKEKERCACVGAAVPITRPLPASTVTVTVKSRACVGLPVMRPLFEIESPAPALGLLAMEYA